MRVDPGEFAVFLFWFVTCLVVLLAVTWFAGWSFGSSTRIDSPKTKRDTQRGAAAVELLAAVFGVAGAFLLATRVHPAFGFGAFLVSNIGWLAFSATRRHWGLLAQQVFFLVSSLIGLWNWWLGPLVLG